MGFQGEFPGQYPEQYGRVRDHYSGWIHVEQSMFDRYDDYVSENFLQFDGGWIAVAQVRYSQPVEVVWTTAKRCYAFDLALNGRPKETAAAIGDAYTINGGQPAEPGAVGRVWMVPPGRTIRSAGNSGHSRTMRCFLDADLVDRHLPETPDWGAGRLARLSTLAVGGEIEWVLRRMYRELTRPDFASTGMIEMLARQLAVEVIRHFELRGAIDGKGGTESFHVGGLAPWRMRLIRERVAAEGPAPSLGELAALCDMTVRHLGRAFRAESGMTIGKFVEAALIERAQEKLLRGLPVGEVAAQLGYATSGSFAAAFRRATGILPSELKASRPEVAN